MTPKTNVPAKYRVLASLVPFLVVLAGGAIISMLVLNTKAGRLAREKRAQSMALLHLDRSHELLDIAGRYARDPVPDFIELQIMADEAVKMALEATARAPEMEEAHRALGLALEMQYNLVEAGTSYEEATALHPSSPAHYRLGRLLTRRIFRSKLTDTPTQPIDADTLGGYGVKALNRTVNPHVEFGYETDEAHRWTSRTCVAYLRDEFGKVIRQGNVAGPLDRTDWLVPTLMGMALLEMEDNETAITTLEEAVRAAPGFADPYAGLATAYLAAGRRTDALVALTNAIKADTHFFEAYLMRARMLIEDRRFTEARVDLEACALLRGDVAEVVLRLGQATYQTWRRSGHKVATDLETAEAALTKAAGLGKNAESYLWRARVRIAKKNDRGAEADLMLALAFPGTEALEEQAALFERTGRWAKAAADYTTAMAKSDNARQRDFLKFRRARAHLEAGDTAAALADYAAMVLEDPRNPSLRAGQALALVAAGKLDEAWDGLKDAPETPGVRVARARVLLAKGDAAGAVHEATAAFEADPQGADALITRAMAYIEIGNSSAARADLEKALSLRPDLVDKVESLRQKLTSP